VDHRVYFRPEDFKDHLDDLLTYTAGDATKPVPILKLHGCIQDPNSLIATIDKTSAGLHDHVRTALDAVLNTGQPPLTWVWVGCSMRDRDMNQWLGGRGADAFDEWWVDPLPGPSLEEFVHEHRTARWASINRQLEDRLVVDSTDRFLAAVAERVASS
jgi:hypothetical protein